MRLGFIGTGTMGNPMVRCLLEAGHQVTVNDLSRDATTNLCEQGAAWADHPLEVAQASQVVFTSLPTPAAVEEVLLHPETGALAGLGQGSAFFDMTSNSPTVFRRLAEVCQDTERPFAQFLRGVELTECSVEFEQVVKHDSDKTAPPTVRLLHAGKRLPADVDRP